MHLSEKRMCAPRITLPSCKAIIACLKRMIKGNRKSRQEETKKDRTKTAYVGAVTRFYLVSKAERQLLTRKRDESAFLPCSG